MLLYYINNNNNNLIDNGYNKIDDALTICPVTHTYKI